MANWSQTEEEQTLPVILVGNQRLPGHTLISTPVLMFFSRPQFHFICTSLWFELSWMPPSETCNGEFLFSRLPLLRLLLVQTPLPRNGSWRAEHSPSDALWWAEPEINQTDDVLLAPCATKTEVVFFFSPCFPRVPKDFMCTCTLGWVCVCVCICVFVCAREDIGQPVISFLRHYPFYCLRQTLLLGSWALLVYSFWSAISQKAPFSSSPVLRSQVCTTRPDFS